MQEITQKVLYGIERDMTTDNDMSEYNIIQHFSLLMIIMIYCGVYSTGKTYITCGSIKSKYQLSLTNPRDVLHHSKSAANKGGRSVR